MIAAHRTSTAPDASRLRHDAMAHSLAHGSIPRHGALQSILPAPDMIQALDDPS